MAKIRKAKHIPAQPAGNTQLAAPRPWHWRQLLLWPWAWLKRYWHGNRFHKIVIVFATAVALSVAIMYGIARWYMSTTADQPIEMGASFIADYARDFGLDADETLEAMLTDLNIKHLRLVSYWDKIEAEPGKYDFAELDSQFAKANQHGAKVSLAIGLRQPRWPECHMPAWAASQPKEIWAKELKDFMGAVIDRYGNNPALESYQLENEYFLEVFGICPDHSRDRLIDEYYFVKGKDHNTPVIISRSNNAIGTPINEPTPDVFGVSVYKRVWVPLIGRYVEYPFPAWFYGFLAGTEKIIKGRETMVHELQAEPWPPHGNPIRETSLEEQNKSLNAERLRGRFEYGRATGMKELDLWGAEYWYYRKVKLNEPSVWEAAKDEYHKTTLLNARYNLK